ncbi:MAG: XRE family transcriptional regulator [Candidatus Melainabacteria bacterium]|nr:MAG: XRE family transcriptional regulator [Candidatus Melainabacteria bacterium]
MDLKDLNKNIADNLRQIRAKNRISQDELAELCGISQQYICKIENEKVNPSIYILFKIADSLKITVNDLIY